MQLVALQVNEQGHPLKSLSPWQISCCALCLGAPGFASQAVKAGVEVEGASAPMVFPTFPLSPFLPSGCVYAVVSLPLSSVSFRCWLISQESRVPLPQPVPSSSFYLAALFSGYVRSAALDAFSKHNSWGQPSSALLARPSISSQPAPTALWEVGWCWPPGVPPWCFLPTFQGTRAAGLCPRALWSLE